MQDYDDFLRNKVVDVNGQGFVIEDDELHPELFQHQRDTVKWACKQGRALIASSFGLGKTRIQCEIARQVIKRSNRPFLVVCPLGVKHQFISEDGPVMGQRWVYVRTMDEYREAIKSTLCVITNYERVRDGNLNISEMALSGVSLDEGSIMRSLGTKTHEQFNRAFAATPYRFVATATPSPNEYTELLNYAEFFGIMPRGNALTRWFKRDSSKAGNLKLNHSNEKEFWLWVASWALFLYAPSDLGYSDAGYALPEMKVHWHRLSVDQTRAFGQVDNRGQRRLLLDSAAGITEASQERRHTLQDRLNTTLEIMLQYYCNQTSNEGEYNGNEGKIQRTQSKVLSEKQGEGKESLSGALLSSQGHNRPREAKGVYAGISKNLQAEENYSREERGNKQETPRALRIRSRISRRNEKEGARVPQSYSKKKLSLDNKLRNNVSGIQRDFGKARRLLCNMRERSKGDENTTEGQSSPLIICGSRSRNRKGKGNTLQSLQLRNRAISQQPGIASESCKISKQWVIWCNLNSEQSALEKAFKANGFSISSIFGALDIEEKENRLYQWKRRETEILLSKPVMLGSGVNLQQCSDAIFMGVDYRFQDFIQAVHRIYRFQQDKVVNIHIIYAESQDAVVETLKRKWREHEHLVEKMRRIIRQYGLVSEAMRKDLNMTIGVTRAEYRGKLFTAVYNDCTLEIKGFGDNSIDLIHTSIPFGNHYSYVPQEGAYNDYGHNPSDDAFWAQMDYLLPDLLRTLKPGRIAAIHVKDRILYGHQTRSGFMEVSPFSDECVTAFRKHGFMYEGRCTIVTDVVRENNSTYRLGWTEMSKDSSKMGFGLPEYLLLFRKPPTCPDTARADEPITKDKAEYTRARWQIDAHSFWRSDGNSPLMPDELYNYYEHVKRLKAEEDRGTLPASFFLEPPKSPLPWQVSPVWDDIVFMRSLNSNQARGREENHICPLPFDIVARAIERWSNPGELVFDPFAGLFTVPYIAMKLNRKGYGVELNSDYYEAGVRYCKEMEQEKTAPTLFDWLETVQAMQQNQTADLPLFNK